MFPEQRQRGLGLATVFSADHGVSEQDSEETARVLGPIEPVGRL